LQQLLQALVELSPAGSDEKSILETIMNHLRARGVSIAAQPDLGLGAGHKTVVGE
jgi:hypothetical protein